MRDAAPLFAELRAAALAPQRSLTLAVTGAREWAGSLRDAGARVGFVRVEPGLPALGLAGLLDPLGGTALGPASGDTLHLADDADTWAPPAEPQGVVREGGFPEAGRHRAGLHPFSGTLANRARRGPAAGARSGRPGDLVPRRPTSTWTAPLATGVDLRFNDPPTPSERLSASRRDPLGPSVLPLSTIAPGSPDPASGSPNAPSTGLTRPIAGGPSRFEEREYASGGSVDGPQAPHRRAAAPDASIHGLLGRLEAVGEVAARPLDLGGANPGRTGAFGTERPPWPGPEPSPVARTGRHRSDPAPGRRSRDLSARLAEAAPASDAPAAPPAGGSDVPGMAQVVRLLEDVVGELGSIGARLAEAGQWGAGPSGSEPAVRWLEDDELAGRLQRILTRQARSRGIDLS